ncbi:MAG: tetratricopeptide repeat protein [Prolixibacteraceae bacterium]
MDEFEKIDRLIQEGNLQEADRLTGEVLAESPENAGLHFRMGQIHYRKQEWGKAINQFQRVLELDPSWPGAKEQIQMANAILGYFTPDMFNP